MSGVTQVRVTVPLAEARRSLGDLEDQLSRHIHDAIDFAALYRFEQLLWGLIDRRNIPDEMRELARELIVDAVIQAVRDPASYFPVRPPRGISETEEKAAAFDENCPFCTMEAERAAYEASPAGRAAKAAWGGGGGRPGRAVRFERQAMARAARRGAQARRLEMRSGAAVISSICHVDI
jgi:hypothetical protein